MRKLFCAIVATLSMAVLVNAADEMRAMKFDKDKKTVTGKIGEKEVTYTVSDKVKVTLSSKDKDGNVKTTEGKYEDLEKRLSKISDKGARLTVTVEKDVITEVTIPGRGGK